MEMSATDLADTVRCAECDHEFKIEQAVGEQPRRQRKTFVRAEQVKTSHGGRTVANTWYKIKENFSWASVLLVLLALSVVGVWCWAFHWVAYDTQHEFFLTDLPYYQQQAVAILGGVIASALIIFSGGRCRLWLCIIALICGAGVAALPWLYKQLMPENPQSRIGLIEPPKNFIPQEPSATPDVDVFLNPTNVEPGTVQERHYTQQDLKPFFTVLDSQNGKGVYGLWVYGISVNNKDAVTAYLKRMSRTTEQPEYHLKAGTASGLLIVKQTPVNFAEFAKIADKMGHVILQDEERSFVELELERNKFEFNFPNTQLENPSSPYFLASNVQELDCLNDRRVLAAAKRLANMKPVDESRNVVVKRLLELLHEPWGKNADYVTSLGVCLAIWALPQDLAAKNMLMYVIEELQKADCAVPAETVHYLIHADPRQGVITMHKEWQKEPSKWEQLYKTHGESGEQMLLATLNTTENAVVKRSAVRILGEVGSENALPPLTDALDTQDAELRLCAELAIKRIEQRLGIDRVAS